jgi:nucleotide-binding universal stress UspA family protein
MRRFLIRLDGSANDAQSLACAVLFCRKLEGRLSVIHARQADTILPGGIDGIGAVVDNSARSAAAVAAARQAFATVCGSLPFASFTEFDPEAGAEIEAQGWLHDVTIVERLDSEEGAAVADFNAALFGTGGLVLAVPPGRVDSVGETVAVHWTPSLQSARALRSALPLLGRARRVIVLTNADKPQADPAAVAAYLDCHGIACESQPFRTANLTGRGRGRALLEALKVSGADTLVMGAFGESRLAALLGLGRATAKVVTACPVPLLMQA